MPWWLGKVNSDAERRRVGRALGLEAVAARAVREEELLALVGEGVDLLGGLGARRGRETRVDAAGGEQPDHEEGGGGQGGGTGERAGGAEGCACGAGGWHGCRGRGEEGGGGAEVQALAVALETALPYTTSRTQWLSFRQLQ